MAEFQFTVFTPVFNRIGLLGRTFESIRRQTFGDFEWLIVDDGSTEDVSGLVREWQQSSPFPIRFIVQAHAGKHFAHNRALTESRGEFFASLDSDDEIVPQALERLLFHWHRIPASERAEFSGVSCLCQDQYSAIVGCRLPQDVVDCTNIEVVTRYRCVGEKWGFNRTSVLREFPFPETPGEYYCTEGLVWNRIATRYRLRHVNEPLRVYHTHSDTLTAHVRQVLMGNPRNTRLYYQECLGFDGPWTWMSKQAINYLRYSLHAGVALGDALSDCPEPLLAAALSLAGAGAYAADRILYGAGLFGAHAAKERRAV